MFNLNVFIHLFIFFAWLGHHQNEWNKFYSISFFVCAYVFSVTVKWLEYYISTCSKTASLLLLLLYTFLFLNSTINTSFFSIHFISSSSFFFIREIHHNHHHHHSPIYTHTVTISTNKLIRYKNNRKNFSPLSIVCFSHTNTLISFSWIYYPIKNKCELWILVKKK